MEYPGS
jgi:hypothetical protein